MRRVPFAIKEEFIIYKKDDEILKAGLIVGSKSTWCSLTLLVRKKDGSMQICIKYRRVNEVKVLAQFPRLK